MTTLPPFTVNVSTRRLACVLDASAALSRHGLLLATRLAQEVDVWLSRALWNILDNTRYHLAHTENLGEEPSDFVNALNRWTSARIETDLARLSIYWVGDACHESSLPPHGDERLITRFESLAAGVDARCNGKYVGAPANADIWLESGRDSLALAVALSPANVLILSAGGSGMPAIAEVFRRAAIPHRELGAGAQASQSALYAPILSRTGILELIWAGLDLSVVHVVAPAAPLAVPGPLVDDEMDTIFSPLRPESDWWDGAEVFWWSVGDPATADEVTGGRT